MSIIDAKTSKKMLKFKDSKMKCEIGKSKYLLKYCKRNNELLEIS